MTQLTCFILNFYIDHCKLPQTVFTAKLKLRIQKEKLSLLLEKDIFLVLSSSSSSSPQFKAAKRAKVSTTSLSYPLIKDHRETDRTHDESALGSQR